MTERSRGDFRGLFDLTGRVAIVTGAAGVLGRDFCAALADHGANVAAVDIDEEGAEAVATYLTQTFGVASLGIACDVADEHSVVEMLDHVEARLGSVDILHNNAATKTKDLQEFFAPTTSVSMDSWREVMSVNLDGMFVMARTVGARMASLDGGSIIQTASIYGLLGPDQRIYEGSRYLGQRISTPAVYSVSKAGVIGLTKHLATEWGGAGVRVNTLIPGGVESGQNDTFVERYSARVPLGRMATSIEMAGALVYLASPASSYVTGQAMIVDGGLSVW